MADGTAERPVSVSDLRKLFEGRGKAQTPSEYSSAARATAARHNLAVRMQQVAWDRKQQKTQPSPFEDPRVAGMIDAEITEFVINAVGSYTDRSKALANVLNADIQVGDSDIDKLSIKELKEYIGNNGGNASGCKKLADFRLCALQAKQVKKAAQGEDHKEGEEYAFFIPQLTTALTTGNDNDINRAILQMFFEEYDPSRLPEVDQLLEKHKGEEDELFAELAWKYPEHANKIVAFTINATYAEAPSTQQTNLKTDNRRRPSYVVSALRMM